MNGYSLFKLGRLAGAMKVVEKIDSAIYIRISRPTKLIIVTEENGKSDSRKRT